MKKHLVTVDVGGEEVVFETDLDVYGPDGEINLKSRRESEDTFVMGGRFTELAKRIKPVSDAIFQSVKSSKMVEEVEIEFGLKLGSRSGIVFTSVDESPNFRVKIKTKSIV